MQDVRCNFKGAKIPEPGVIRLSWVTLYQPGDAPAISEGDTLTRKLDGDRRWQCNLSGVLDWNNCAMILEKFTRKDRVLTYEFTIELAADESEVGTPDLMRRILMHDLSGDLTLQDVQIGLDLGDKSVRGAVSHLREVLKEGGATATVSLGDKKIGDLH